VVLVPAEHGLAQCLERVHAAGEKEGRMRMEETTAASVDQSLPVSGDIRSISFCVGRGTKW
jgi:hypothetical protein